MFPTKASSQPSNLGCSTNEERGDRHLLNQERKIFFVGVMATLIFQKKEEDEKKVIILLLSKKHVWRNERTNDDDGNTGGQRRWRRGRRRARHQYYTLACLASQPTSGSSPTHFLFPREKSKFGLHRPSLVLKIFSQSTSTTTTLDVVPMLQSRDAAESCGSSRRAAR